jgi:hypothetical protein
MIVGVDDEARRNERIDGIGVAPHVFTHPMGDLNHGPGRAAAVPTGARDAQSVGLVNRKRSVGTGVGEGVAIANFRSRARSIQCP